MTAGGNESSRDHLLDGLFDEGVHATGSALVFGPDDLPAEEGALVASAIASRQREFSTGRVLARRLLARVGKSTGPLLRDDERVPLWPEGVVGSISHCSGFCVVALANREDQRGLGVDVEPDEPVEEGVERIVCRAEEHEWLDGAKDAEDRARRVKLVFSVKEATYKAFYPELRTFWSFQEVGIEVDLEHDRFRASLPEGPDVRVVEGRVARRGGWILSTVCRGR